MRDEKMEKKEGGSFKASQGKGKSLLKADSCCLETDCS